MARRATGRHRSAGHHDAGGRVDGLVGAIHTTANTIRPALQTAPGSTGVVLGVLYAAARSDQWCVAALFCQPTHRCGLAELPLTPPRRPPSASATGVHAQLSTGRSGAGSEKRSAKPRVWPTARPRPARRTAMTPRPSTVDRQKRLIARLPGRATVFVFPDLNTDLTCHKTVQRSAILHQRRPHVLGFA
jgi:hypothetical protein